MEHTYIAIDLKSFYASVECQERDFRSDDNESGCCGSKSYRENNLSCSLSFF